MFSVAATLELCKTIHVEKLCISVYIVRASSRVSKKKKPSHSTTPEELALLSLLQVLRVEDNAGHGRADRVPLEEGQSLLVEPGRLLPLEDQGQVRGHRFDRPRLATDAEEEERLRRDGRVVEERLIRAVRYLREKEGQSRGV